MRPTAKACKPHDCKSLLYTLFGLFWPHGGLLYLGFGRPHGGLLQLDFGRPHGGLLHSRARLAPTIASCAF
jgi:hypothetical protein